MKPIIVVHGGAGGWKGSASRRDRAIEDCRAAARAGQAVLLAKGSATDAVETAVRILEDSPVLDAGRGSYLNTDGEIEMDALIMDGETMNLGAVAAVRLVMHPISLARKVMSDCEHALLVGRGAEAFADSIGFPRCNFQDLLDEEMGNDYLVQSEESDQDNYIVVDQREPEVIGDTVGAVALDYFGNLASGTSTGGTKGKRPGRVGDSPLVGSGAYADNWNAAASATGHGEALMTILISKRVCDFVAEGLSTQKACEAAIDVLHERVQGEGGLIAIDVRGRVGVAYNTAAMPHAYAIASGDVIAGS
ncbi:MAG: isoaspartyl peptidase/L-asparaginase [Candidatus Promineifilaceae bacterium]